LMDAWCLAHTGAPFDEGGGWAAQGTVSAELLSRLQDEPFFAKAPPKSTGRDLFNAPWLQPKLAGLETLPHEDVQATLTELTAQACASSLLGATSGCETLIVCGGGAFNSHLMARLQMALPACRVVSSARFGLPPLQVEATAFAWLAHQAMERQSASVPSVTGARGARILGAIYPA
jgi:anhydro-N-acetylmuramic acid kinase